MTAERGNEKMGFGNERSEFPKQVLLTALRKVSHYLIYLLIPNKIKHLQVSRGIPFTTYLPRCASARNSARKSRTAGSRKSIR